MTGYTNLSRRGAVYYYRAVVPVDILEIYQKTYGDKKTVEQFSLGTKEKQEAISKWRKASAKVEERFAACREMLRSQSIPLADRVTDQYLEDTRKEVYRMALAGDEHFKLLGIPDPRDKDKRLSYSAIADKRKADLAIEAEYSEKYYQQVNIDAYINSALKRLGAHETQRDTIEVRKVARVMQEAWLQAKKDIQKRNDGTVVITPPKPKASTKRPSKLSPNHPLLSEAMKLWVREHSGVTWTGGTEKSNKVWVKCFISIYGDHPLGGYTKQDALEFKQVLMSLPPNWKNAKAFKGLGALEVSKMAQERELKSVSPVTAKKNLNFVSGFWKWVYANYDIEKNIFEGISIAAKRNRQGERDPFSAADLRQIFSSPVYTGCLRDDRPCEAGNYSLRGTDRYWIPLLALYTGARLNELMQLTHLDVYEVEGIPVFDFNKRVYKRAKTDESPRVIPIHSTLIDLGFLEFVESKRNASNVKKKGGVDRLFTEYGLGKSGADCSSYGRHFGTLLSTVGVKTSKKTFHSFRHAFIDACRNSGVPKDVMQALIGHAVSDTTSDYGLGYSPVSLNKWLQKVSYGDLEAKLRLTLGDIVH